MLKGSLAPRGAVVKQSAVHPNMLQHMGPARVFESEDELREIRIVVERAQRAVPLDPPSVFFVPDVPGAPKAPKAPKVPRIVYKPDKRGHTGVVYDSGLHPKSNYHVGVLEAVLSDDFSCISTD